MKSFSRIVAAVSVAFIAILAADAQTPGQQGTISPSTAGVIPDGKIATFDTTEFGDPKTGITRLVKNIRIVSSEFKPADDELARLRAQYDQLAKDIAAARSSADQKMLQVKIDQSEALKKETKRKEQEVLEAYNKRIKELISPIYDDISAAIKAYGKQRGIDIIIDVSRLDFVILVTNRLDITAAFIADYNQRNAGSPASGAMP